MKPQDLLRRLRSSQPPCVLDVRSGFEFRAGHIPGAVHASLLKLLFRRARLPADRGTRLVLTCEHGPRAMLAESMLRRRGYGDVVLLEGQMAGWKKAGLPLDR